MVAQDPEIARLADRVLRRFRNLVLGLIARRLAIRERQQALQLRRIEADQVEVEALVPYSPHSATMLLRPPVPVCLIHVLPRHSLAALSGGGDCSTGMLPIFRAPQHSA
jgi:hypothetical protein